MKKTIILMIIALGFASSFATAQEESQMKTRQKPVETEMRTRPVETPKVAEKPMKGKSAEFKADVTGKVISLAKLSMGGDASVTKAEAEELVKAGQPLAIKQGEEIFMVYNAKNMFDGKSLVKYAEANNLGIAGEVKYVDGFAVIIAKKMQVID